MRYTQSLLLKYAIRRVILYLLARVLGHTHTKKHSKNTIVKTFKIYQKYDKKSCLSNNDI